MVDLLFAFPISTLRSPKRRRQVAVLSFYSFQRDFCALFALFDTEKNKKRYSTDDTVADENHIKISRQTLDSLTRWVFVVVPFLRGRFSLLSSRASRWFVVLLLFISLSKGRNFFILMIPEPRARAMMPRAARPSSNTKYSRRRPRRRDALFRRLALTPKAFFKTEDKRARQREVEEENIKEKEGAQKLFSVPGIFSSRGRAL